MKNKIRKYIKSLICVILIIALILPCYAAGGAYWTAGPNGTGPWTFTDLYGSFNWPGPDPALAMPSKVVNGIDLKDNSLNFFWWLGTRWDTSWGSEGMSFPSENWNDHSKHVAGLQRVQSPTTVHVTQGDEDYCGLIPYGDGEDHNGAFTDFTYSIELANTEIELGCSAWIPGSGEDVDGEICGGGTVSINIEEGKEFEFSGGEETFAPIGTKWPWRHTDATAYGITGGDSRIVCPKQDSTQKLAGIYDTGLGYGGDYRKAYVETDTIAEYYIYDIDGNKITSRPYGVNSYNDYLSGSETMKDVNSTCVSLSSYPFGTRLTTDYQAYWMNPVKPGTYENIYLKGASHRLPNPMIIYTSTATDGGRDSSGVPHSSTGTGLYIDSIWDTHTEVQQGLEKLGVLDANGGDRNCVVDGGSTIFIRSGNEDEGETEAYFSIVGYIPLYWWQDSDWTRDREPWAQCGCGEEFDLGTSAPQQYDYTAKTAFDCGERVAKYIAKSLGDMRLQMYAAEGLYKQGQEDAFFSRAQCITGENMYDTDSTDAQHKLHSTPLTNKAQYATGGTLYRGSSIPGKISSTSGKEIRTFGSFYGTTGSDLWSGASASNNEGTGNYLSEDNKYLFKANSSKDGEEIKFNDLCSVELVNKNYHIYGVYADPTTTNDATVHVYDYEYRPGTDGLKHPMHSGESRGWRSSFSAKAVASNGFDYNTTHDKVQSKLGERFRQANAQTGWLTNILYDCNYDQGSGNVRNVTGAKSAHKEGWYNEGFADMGLYQFTYEFKLNLKNIHYDEWGDVISSELISKQLVIDPALCGQSINEHDTRTFMTEAEYKAAFGEEAFNKEYYDEFTYTNPEGGSGNIKIPLKNKVRTLRFQLASRMRQDDKSVAEWMNEFINTTKATHHIKDSDDGFRFIKNEFAAHLDDKMTDGLIGAADCIESLYDSDQMSRDGTWFSGSTAGQWEAAEYDAYGNLKTDTTWYTLSESSHGLAAPIYAKLDMMLNSKFIYLTNATIRETAE